MKKSWLFSLNYYFCQWFFFRLARKCNDDDKTIGWCILWGVLPMTGWTSDYRYLPGFGR